jgi:5,10-methylenetetrahydrofolate reductase
MAEKSNFQQMLESGEFAITAEICPPRGTDIGNFIKKARLLKDCIVAANVTDNQRAVMRLSSLAASSLLVEEGMEPVFQVTCRDRNRIAIQSDLLGATVLGIKNVLLLTGDHVSCGDHRGAMPVFDLDAVQLIHTAKTLNGGENLNGMALRGATDLHLGAVVSPDADPWEPEEIKFEKKIAAGATFFQSQAIYDMDKFKRFFEGATRDGIRILGGILLLKSSKMAHFLNKNVPGVDVPAHLIEELEGATDQLEKGIEIASRQVRELKSFCDGAHIMAISQEASVPKIIAEA